MGPPPRHNSRMKKLLSLALALTAAAAMAADAPQIEMPDARTAATSRLKPNSLRAAA